MKQKVNSHASYGSVDIETQRNILKEELQYYLLNFIYHHTDYSQWIMYGGSALRICHGLNRMSVDLDFEINHACADNFLKKVQADIQKYFIDRHSLGPELLKIKITHGRGLKLCFLIGDALEIKHSSKQVHVKIDLNHFMLETEIKAVERIPINHDQLSFVIKGYNMSTLMASKIAAIFLRGERGIGTAIYEEKGRDVYDLLWYMDMERKIVPNLNYLAAKGIKISSMRDLLDRLTIKMNKVSDTNLRQDLIPLFVDQSRIEDWISQWRESFLHLKEGYQIRTITTLNQLSVEKYLLKYVYHILYVYGTEEGSAVKIRYTLSDDWIDRNINLPIPIDRELVSRINYTNGAEESDKLKQFVTLFHNKAEDYLRKNNHVLLGDAIITKTIRCDANKLDQKEQIALDMPTLLSCELEDLLK
ncbi:MAG: nucleotidyl transferase AbiEii/AbiGii toxin family protein [Elusimicrobia bacterium]|nr:nucleotidyl transferase AbiEii/AbiGii toxin family protein [Elusimicrobiota bacterium]